MGQYFKVVNLTKKEYFSPSQFGDGIKFSSLGYGIHNVVLARLLCSPGDMDYPVYHEKFGNSDTDEIHLGYWSGDQIVIPGDSEKTDENDDNLYYRVNDDSEYEDIGPKLFSWLCRDQEILETLAKRAKTQKHVLENLAKRVSEEGGKRINYELNKYVGHKWSKLLGKK